MTDELDDPITYDGLDDAANSSGRALQELRAECVGIEWVDSETLENDEGGVTGCHYRAGSEDAVREHGDRSGRPVTRVYRRGQPLEGE